MAEIGRLREIAFRCVGEGTGGRRDLDRYDRHYRHLILWDEEDLEYLGVSVPTLYKQYSELCEPGGVRFLDFGVDADFNHCVDGLVLVDTDSVKARKRQRYIGETNRDEALDTQVEIV